MSNKCGQIISVKIGRESVDKVFHDNTLKGVGRPDDLLGIADSVLEDIESKVSDVMANGESVVVDHVANLTIPTDISDITTPEQQAAINSGMNSEKAEQITTNQNNIASIDSKIPSQASAENQLADKNFVNSSVATNTANFIGTFNSVADLEAYSGTLTNNDYAFVISTDSAGNTVYNRYKYTTATDPASWQFEYALNNSSFTAEQWAAINSGATTTNIGQIATNTTAIQGKLDKVTSTSGTIQVYAKDMNGSQVMLDTAQGSAGFNTLARRTATGTLRVATPTDNADATTKLYVDTALSSKANTADVATISLNNLNSTGKNISNWSSNVSNCITEIPQDITLTLSNGTLTLKAGSKITFGDGRTYQIASDVTTTYTANGTALVFSRDVDGAMNIFPVTDCVSGATDPMAGSATQHIWFDTSTSHVYRVFPDASTAERSLPLAQVTVSNGAISSIDQVFNGFGYIGSTVFVLPGVSVATAAGINSNGTLNSFYATITSVKTNTSTLTRNGKLLINSDGAISWALDYSYNAENNRIYNYGLQNAACVAILNRGTNGAVTLLQPFKPFHAVDYSDTEYIGHQAAPSSRYTPLSLPASGGTVTAPADGYIYINKVSGAAGQGVILGNGVYEKNMIAVASDEACRLLYPVSKGMTVGVNYTLTGTTNSFRFIYANGAK